MLSSVPQPILNFVAGGGGAAVVLLLFQRFSGGWIDSRFASRLEGLKHQQTSELERWKAETARAQDRATRITQREFEEVPKVWIALNDAFSAVQSMARFLKQHADLSGYTDEEVILFLDGEDLPEIQKREIRDALPKDRNQVFGRAIQFREIGQAHNACVEAHHLLSRGAIFLDELTVGKIRHLLDLMWDAVVDFRVSQEHAVPRPKDGPLERFRNEGIIEFRALEKFLRTQYYPDERGPNEPSPA